MTIEVKFKPSDDIWFMYDNKPKHGFINAVKIRLERDDKMTTEYHIYGIEGYFYEHGLFPTKEALLQSL
jgi:hypothetical protein